MGFLFYRMEENKKTGEERITLEKTAFLMLLLRVL
jgi:hypothetical protein